MVDIYFQLIYIFFIYKFALLFCTTCQRSFDFVKAIKAYALSFLKEVESFYDWLRCLRILAYPFILFPSIQVLTPSKWRITDSNR